MILCDLCLGENQPQLVRVRDMSELGLRIATTIPLVQGMRLKVMLPGATDWLPARVVWANGRLAGLAFSRAVELPRVTGAKRGGDETPPPPLPGKRAA